MYNAFGKLVPDTIPYYYFGIESNLQALFRVKNWASKFQPPASMQVPYFDSPEFNRLKSALLDRQITPGECIFIEIGHDGFNTWRNEPERQTWGVWLRVKNVNADI